MSNPALDAISASFRRFFAGTLFSRATGFGRELAMAMLFGAGAEVAAFWMAFRFATLLRRLFGEGGLHVAFVPHFESLRKRNTQEANAFFLGLALGLGALLVALAVIGELALGGILFFSSLPASDLVIYKLTFLMLPSFVFVSLYALNASLLQCEGNFFTASAAPSLLNLLWMIVLPLLPQEPGIALERLAMIVVAGLALQWLVTWISVYRTLRPTLADIRLPKLREYTALLRPFGLALLGVGATQINGALDACFARFSDLEGPAILWYALRLEQLPLALVGIGVSAAFFPPIARAAATGDAEGRATYSLLLNQACKRTLLCLVPLTVALIILGLLGVNFVYGRGAFSESATFKTTYALWAYGLGLVPSTLLFIFASAFYAHKNFTAPTYGALFSVALNLGLNTLFVFGLELGATSIALATSLSALFNAVYLGIALRRTFGSFGKGLIKTTLKITLASAIAASGTLLIDALAFHSLTLKALLGGSPTLPHGLISQLLPLCCEGLFFLTLLLISAALLRCRELFETILPSSLHKRII